MGGADGDFRCLGRSSYATLIASRSLAARPHQHRGTSRRRCDDQPHRERFIDDEEPDQPHHAPQPDMRCPGLTKTGGSETMAIRTMTLDPEICEMYDWRRDVRESQEVSRMRKTAGLIAGVVLLLLAAASPALGKVTVSEWEQTSVLTRVVAGCHESVLITGTETFASEYKQTPSARGVEQFRYRVTWDAEGVGQSSGEVYEVRYQEKGEGAGWPPLAPPTTNVVANHGTLWLTSDAFGVEMHKWNAHRNLHDDEETGITTERGTFYKTSDTC